MGAGYGSMYAPAPVKTGGAAPSSSGGGGNNSWWFYLAAAALVLLGYGQFKDYTRARAAQSGWTRTSGIVTEHKVRRLGTKSPHTYSTHLSYSYDINGDMHDAAPVEINKNKFYMSEDSAYGDLHEEFPRGGSITVYYDPDNPGDSSLGAAGAPGLAAPMVFFLLAFGAAWFGRQQ
ncbi:MAG: DUF3592 domain-containing protein [Elusimicrobiales bacterium]